MDVPNRYSRCNRQHCNLWQSSQERRAKYDYCRSSGASSYMAIRLRDWRWKYIFNYFTYAATADNLILQSESLTEAALKIE